jgi:creatinine amidohydrolase
MALGDRVPRGTIVFPFQYWDALSPEQLAEYLGAEVGLHANIGETSAVMAVDESLVDLEQAVKEYPAFPTQPTAAMIAAYFFSARGTLTRASRSGVWGDPTGSTAERGRRYFEQIEDACVRFVEEVEALFAAFPERSA